MLLTLIEHERNYPFDFDEPFDESSRNRLFTTSFSRRYREMRWNMLNSAETQTTLPLHANSSNV